MNYKLFTLSIISIIIFNSCSVEPREIKYGEEVCNFCSMTVEDTKHASQIISKKGKIFTYGSIECMMRDNLNSYNDLILASVNDFESEKALINAEDSYYLIHEGFKSPMGANLSAFKDRKIAEKLNGDHKGQVLNWEQLKIHFEIEKKNSKEQMKCEAGKCAPGKCGGSN